MLPNIHYWNRQIFDPEPENDWSGIDQALWLPDDAHVERLAAAMDGAHIDQADPTAAWRVAEHRQVGIYGERAFSRVFCTNMDTAIRKYGNHRKNVTLQNGAVVDVVTRRIVRGGRIPDLTRRVKGHGKRADVCCLVLWVGRGWEPVFLGWLEDAEIRERGVIQEFQPRTKNYVVAAANLRPMWELMAGHDPDSPLTDPDSIVQPAAPTALPDVVQLDLFGGAA
jgi:hypothetical protein